MYAFYQFLLIVEIQPLVILLLFMPMFKVCLQLFMMYLLLIYSQEISWKHHTDLCVLLVWEVYFGLYGFICACWASLVGSGSMRIDWFVGVGTGHYGRIAESPLSLQSLFLFYSPFQQHSYNNTYTKYTATRQPLTCIWPACVWMRYCNSNERDAWLTLHIGYRNTSNIW